MSVQYARTRDGTQVAYRVVKSDSDRTIVYIPGALYSVESMEDDPPYARFLNGLAELGRLLEFERQGIGASDSLTFDIDIYRHWSEGVIAVLDAVGAEKAILVGYCPGATTALQTAVSFPDRVESVVALHPTVRAPAAASALDGLRDLMDAVVARDVDASEQIWELLMPSRCADVVFRAWNQRSSQIGASPRTAQQIWSAVFGESSTLAGRLHEVACPVLVLHRRDVRLLSLAWSQALVDALPHGVLVELDGADWVPNAGNVDQLNAEIAAFVTGERRIPASQRPVLSILFTDIVDSTSRLSTHGDNHWGEVLDLHDQIVQRALARHGGTLVKTTGDGALATFETPTRAVLGAIELRDALAAAGIPVRTAVHVGEVDRRGDDVAGTAVHLAARIMGWAGPGEVLTSAAVPIATAGGALRFESLGLHALKGFTTEFELYRVVG